jgi:anti-sigma regulatory factor (Ser/Thr protein kinase)
MTVDNGELYGAHACPSGVDSPRQLRMTLPAVSNSVRLSRYATRAVLTAWQLSHVDETATLLISELVTNAVRHARGTDVVTVDLHAGRTWLRIEVQDTDRRWPQPRTPDVYDESGFGFILVNALSSNWGVRETDAGKAVWAELDTRPESGAGI